MSVMRPPPMYIRASCIRLTQVQRRGPGGVTGGAATMARRRRGRVVRQRPASLVQRFESARRLFRSAQVVPEGTRPVDELRPSADDLARVRRAGGRRIRLRHQARSVLRFDRLAHLWKARKLDVLEVFPVRRFDRDHEPFDGPLMQDDVARRFRRSRVGRAERAG